MLLMNRSHAGAILRQLNSMAEIFFVMLLFFPGFEGVCCSLAGLQGRYMGQYPN